MQMSDKRGEADVFLCLDCIYMEDERSEVLLSRHARRRGPTARENALRGKYKDYLLHVDLHEVSFQWRCACKASYCGFLHTNGLKAGNYYSFSVRYGGNRVKYKRKRGQDVARKTAVNLHTYDDCLLYTLAS